MSEWFTADGEPVDGLPDPGTTNRFSTLEAKGGFYRPNFRSFGEFILSDQVREPVAAVAREIAITAGAFAPKRKTDGGGPRDGSLSASFRVQVHAGTIVVDRAPRVKVEVFSEDSAAAAMEFGNSRVGKPGHRMLARAGAAFGDFKSGARP